MLIAARNPRRKELIGIIDWRVAELERLGVAFGTIIGSNRTKSPSWARTP